MCSDMFRQASPGLPTQAQLRSGPVLPKLLPQRRSKSAQPSEGVFSGAGSRRHRYRLRLSSSPFFFVFILTISGNPCYKPRLCQVIFAILIVTQRRFTIIKSYLLIKFLYYYKVLQLYYYKSGDWLLGFYSYLLAGSSAPRAARAGQEKSIGLFPPVAPLTLPAGPPPFSSMNSTPAHSKVVIKQREGTQNSAEVPK